MMPSELKSLEDIQDALIDGRFEFSRHAFRRAVERNISDQEIRQAGESVMIIENYPYDKFTPSCLLLGYTHSRRPLHIQVSRAYSSLVKIITLYEPDPLEWDVSFSIRR